MTKLLTSVALALSLASGAALAQTAAPSTPAPSAPAATKAPAAPTVTKADPANDAKFKASDKNGNGTLDGAEVTAFKADMVKIDTDKDGKISRAEYDVAVKSGTIKQ